MRVVIALGGNALLPKGAAGTAAEQRKAAKSALRRLSGLLRSHEVALTHGNGPQVGSLLLQQHATRKVPEMPLDVLDAMTQGEIGYFMQGALPRKSAAVLTRVVVSEKDPAFRHPTKPVGPFYAKKPKGKYVMDSGRGYRLVVPSPKALGILEKDAIITLMRAGFAVVCGGGGGIPVAKGGRGLEAVIDKDDFSSLLASTVKADLLVFITSVDCAYRDFSGAKIPIRRARAAEMERLLRSGEFAEGSMKPKVEAAVRFARHGGKAVICSIGNIREALAGKAGTAISR
ncbi:MAG TPA: carbamate kinase [Candidatus Bilamarchaeum sp.]|nr:carbamate kinase [Candidatus Bilamarchaeum sp.]